VSEYYGSSEVLPSDQARELAAIHDICIQHEDKLQQLSATQPQARILVAITDGIKKQKEKYLTDAGIKS